MPPTPLATTPDTRATRRRAPQRVPGLDGIRALAVTAVLAFHACADWLPGGFLGVDVFFVVSGYLITRQLLAAAPDGWAGLRTFYARRARRLLPALGVVLAAVALAGLVCWHDRVAALRTDLLASVGYVTNWWFVARHNSYFLASGPPSPLQHLWSLAVEEQFYLLWPALLLLVLRVRTRASRPTRVAVLAGAGALASTVLMAVLAVAGDVPYRTDSSRLYFGTDTHAMGLLAGAALAGLLDRYAGRLRRVPPGLAELAAGLAVLGLVWSVARLDEYRPGLYRGGFLAVSLLAALLVAACTHPAAFVGRTLDVRPLRWLGQRSYEVYLWHWPVFLLLGLADPDTPGLVALARLPFALLVTGVASELTHRFVTVPVWRGWAATRRRWYRPAAVAGAVVAALVGLALVRVPAPVEPGLAAVAARQDPAGSAAPSPSQSGAPTGSGSPTPSPAPGASRSAGGPIAVGVSAFGDSVLLGASPALRTVVPDLRVTATVGIQAAAVFSRIRSAARDGRLARVVLIHTGNNGVVSADDLDRLLTRLSGELLVVVVNDHLPRTWQRPNNAVFARVVPRHANAVLVDWYTAADGHTSWFAPDRVHLQPSGARAYAALIQARMAERLAPAPGTG